MWNKNKSLMLSLICTKIVILLLIALAVALPFLRGTSFFSGAILLREDSLYFVMTLIYLAWIPAMIAMVCLHKLLTNIRQEHAFTEKTGRLLRIISWTCFLAGIIMFVGTTSSPAFFLLGVIACFVGLILRVVKNVIDYGREIKDENDFTI